MRTHLRSTSVLGLVLGLAACAAPGEPRPSPARDSTPIVAALIAGDYETARVRSEEALYRQPRSGWLLYNRGVALAGLGRVQEALDVLRDAEQKLQAPGDRALAAYRRALILEFAGRCPEAATEYAHYAALTRAIDPKVTVAAESHLRFCVPPPEVQRVVRHRIARLEDRSEDTVRHHVETASTSSVAALIQGDFDTALAQADIGLAVAPEDPWLLYNRGTALAELDRTDEALATLRRAEEQFGAGESRGRSLTIYRRALALEVAGRCDEAKDALDAYAEATGGSDPRFIRHAVAHLRFCRYAQRAR